MLDLERTAERKEVKAHLAAVESHWNWRISAHCRIGSLAALWLVVVFMTPLGWLLAPLAALRSGLSLLQAVLNVRLGNRSALESQTRADWALVAAIVVAAYFAAGMGQITGDTTAPWLFLPMLLPFTMLQARMVRRSYSAAHVEELRPKTLVRLEDYQRSEPGELRAA